MKPFHTKIGLDQIYTEMGYRMNSLLHEQS